MIANLRGHIDFVGENFIVLRVGQIGYKVFVSPTTRATLEKNTDEILLWTYMSVREDAQELFGFLSRDEQNFFEKLLRVPGIGPKSALSVLSAAPLDILSNAIRSENLGYLTKISGIGKKTAEKIILELKDKTLTESTLILGDELDALEALKALGYSQEEAREALKKISKDAVGTSAKVSEALRILGGQ